MTILLGCDFTSAPSKRKPVTLAVGRSDRGRVLLERIETFETLDAWQARLAEAPPAGWVGGFDLPFGLPRELVETLGWPTAWRDCMAHYASLSREQIRDTFAAFCDARPVGGKFAHRATDGPAGSSPSMKWVNPPVAFMLHAGVPRLIAAGVTLAGLHEGDPRRIALEAYPGLLARSVLGSTSYKSDDRAKQTPERLIARKTLIHALESGEAPMLRGAGLRLKLSHAQREEPVNGTRGAVLGSVVGVLMCRGIVSHCSEFEEKAQLHCCV